MKKTIKSKNKKNQVRLDSSVTPVHYAITLKPDLEAHNFSGQETITIALNKPVKEITLHAKKILIQSARVIFGKNNLNSLRIQYNEKNETATFFFDKNIPKGKIKLILVFSGIISDDLSGFYKSKYVVDGKEHIMATTQFEATYARKCIPCFDEPAHKAVFDVNLIIPIDKTAISNTLPTSVIEHEAGYKIVSFASTPKMSTYLLAFIIGDFEWVEQKTKSGVLVRVFAVPGKLHQTKFALDTTVRCLEFYENYFGIKYPLNTLDMIAIPDFSSLAMENWGAITFREMGLLLDENNSSTSAKELIAEVIAHELAHQWFGNLVTMEWWTHLWLNEGFASYIPYLALDNLFPDWHIWDQFTVDTLATALKLDSLKNTHPIEVEVHHPNEIGEIFDAVSYRKGASVIRMLAEYLGPRMFQKGLSHYLKKHSYKNASTIHLWESFEKVSKKPIKKMMAVWTGKSGYPVLSVEEKNNKLILSQKRYFSSQKSARVSKDSTAWPVPLSLVLPSGKKNLGLMSNKKSIINLPKEKWFKINAHEGALHRTRYSKDILENLKLPIRELVLLPEDRLGIIRDLFSLSEAGEYKTSLALDFVANYKNETEYIVWAELISGLRYVDNLLYGTKAYEPFRIYARSIVEAITQKIGWTIKNGESHNDSLLRPLVLGASTYFGNDLFIHEALNKFWNHKQTPIPADLRGVIYATAARNGGEKEAKELLSMYKAENLHEEKNRILSSLGLFKDKEILNKHLEFVISKEVRVQDRNDFFAAILFNFYGREMGWNFIKKHWSEIGEIYEDGSHALTYLISFLNRNTTKTALKDIKEFFKKHKAESAKRTIDQTLERIESNILWLERDKGDVVKFFSSLKL